MFLKKSAKISCIALSWLLGAAAPPAFAGGIDRIGFFTTDIEAALVFWQQGLGYEPLFDAPDMRGAALAEAIGLPGQARVRIVLLKPGPDGRGPIVDLWGISNAELRPGVAPAGSPPLNGAVRLVVRVDDIDATVARLRAIGAQGVEPAKRQQESIELGRFGAVSPPDYEAFVLTPEGIPIQLMELERGSTANCYLDCEPEHVRED